MATAPALALLGVAFEAATAACAVWGLVRLERLHALARDPRLRRLSWLFGLLAGSAALQTLSTAIASGIRRAAASGAGAARPGLPNLLDAAHHALLLGALGVAVCVFGMPWRRPPAPAPAALAIAWLGTNGVFGIAEAAVSLYIAAAAALNLRRRRSPGSLRVALGFLLLFAAHLGAWLLSGSGGRPFWAEGLTLAGVFLLVLSVPRRTV